MFVNANDLNISTLSQMPGFSLAIFNYQKDIGLVLQDGSEKYVVFLTKLNMGAFEGFECTGNEHWKGVFISGIEIEVDLPSLEFDNRYALGCLRTSQGKLSLMARIKKEGYTEGQSILISDKVGDAAVEVNIPNWRIVKRVGKDVSVLVSVKGGVADLSELIPDSE